MKHQLAVEHHWYSIMGKKLHVLSVLMVFQNPEIDFSFLV